MALVKCENCGAPVSNLGTKCPKCGTPIRKGNDGSVHKVNPAKPKRRHGGMVSLVVTVIVVAVGAAAFGLLGGEEGGEPRVVEVSDSDRTADLFSSCADELQAVEVSDSDIYQEEYGDNVEDYLDPITNWDNNFPTPEYIYTGLLNPQTRNQEKFFADLIEHDFNHVELFEYTNSVGLLSFSPGTAQDAVFIIIHEDVERQLFVEHMRTFFSDKVNCTIEPDGDGISIAYDYY